MDCGFFYTIKSTMYMHRDSYFVRITLNHNTQHGV